MIRKIIFFILPSIYFFGLMNMARAQESVQWPRTFINADGSQTRIPHQPMRVLSTSVTVTGTLLTIDAPVIASATTSYGHYFDQWKHIAQKRGVTPLWPAGQVDIEKAIAIQPDLIVVSKSGADSALDQLSVLRQIAPTIIVDYGNQTWQSLAQKLGYALGTTAHVNQVIDTFNAHINTVRQRLSIPAGQANIISYHGAGMANPIAQPTSAHGQLLASLGFSVEAPDPAWNETDTIRNNFIWAHYEQLSQLKGTITFLLSADDTKVPAFISDPVLKNMPSVRAGQVYGLGKHSFRIDYYSAMEIVDGIEKHFSHD
ncbi:Fe2+-enterobactin ABC transporter substrate-binding protein [Vibrio salinus]|uniref:Fe2+-enterobactin ABC transporter substrate-binding protein n=1 Tax=Vibrio salinus TaxID=2899784 RepID=UPI001E3C197B|nr:Fe2+-enterobactin ABC transporter substrate-binding protein [Vibrio salinus]MCE0493095.1 Fe2+-enterobactin ABC transporter substrate-binding protein [Vibrio salinus]